MRTAVYAASIALLVVSGYAIAQTPSTDTQDRVPANRLCDGVEIVASSGSAGCPYAGCNVLRTLAAGFRSTVQSGSDICLQGAAIAELEPTAVHHITVLGDGKGVVAKLVWPQTQQVTNNEGTWTGRVPSNAVRVSVDGWASRCVVLNPIRRDERVVLSRPSRVVVELRGVPEDGAATVEWEEDSGCVPQSVTTTRMSNGLTRVASLIRPDRGYLSVAVRGFVPLRIGPLAAVAGETVDLGKRLLEKGRSVRGVVRDQRHAIIAGASVAFERLDGPYNKVVVSTDSQGRYESTLPECGIWRAVVGAVPEASAARVVDGASVDLVVPSGQYVWGRVRDRESKPIAGARVAMTSATGAGRTLNVITGVDGVFEADTPLSGMLEVRASRDDAGAATVICGGQSRPCVGLDIAVGDGPTLNGIVRDSEGRPAGSATVCVLSNPRRCVSTNREGHFWVRLPAAGQVRLEAFQYGEGVASQVIDRLGDEVIVVLQPQGKILAGIRGATESAAGAIVRDHKSGRVFEAVGNGDFAGTLPVGPHRIDCLEYADGQIVRAESADVEVRKGETAQVEFGGGVVVSGRIKCTHADDSASVTATRLTSGRAGGNLTDMVARAKADDQGRYELPLLRPGLYTLLVVCNARSETRNVEVGDRDLRLDLDVAGGAIDGVVLDERNGAPIGGAQVMAFNREQSYGALHNKWAAGGGEPAVDSCEAIGTVGEAVSNARGEFSVPQPAGGKTLRVSADGYRPESLSLADRDGDRIQVRMTPLSGLVGVVQDEYGVPMAGAAVTAACGAELSTDSAFSDDSGVFRFDMPIGQRCVIAARSGDLIGMTDLAVADGDNDTAVVPLGPPGGVRLHARAGGKAPRLLLPSGAPLDIVLRLAGAGELRPVISKDADGSVEVLFSLVPPGRFLVVDQGGSGHEVTVRAGAVSDVNVIAN